MAHPIGYLLTWTTYGTWLPGDRRGWVNRLNNCPGIDVNPPCPRLEEAARRQMKSPDVHLTPEQRQIVAFAIREVCRFRNWELAEVNCRFNHVHAVVRCAEAPADKVREQFKAYATRAMRAAGHFLCENVWTRGGSARGLYTEESFAAACEYVRNQ